jgi:hypothetical protein
MTKIGSIKYYTIYILIKFLYQTKTIFSLIIESRRKPLRLKSIHLIDLKLVVVHAYVSCRLDGTVRYAR